MALANAPPLFVPSLVAKLTVIFSLDISFLPLNFVFPERVIVARPIKIDNIVLAWIFENRLV